MLSALSRPPYGYMLAACAPREQTMNYNALSKQREQFVRSGESFASLRRMSRFTIEKSNRNMTSLDGREFTDTGIYDADALE